MTPNQSNVSPERWIRFISLKNYVDTQQISMTLFIIRQFQKDVITLQISMSLFIIMSYGNEHEIFLCNVR